MFNKYRIKYKINKGYYIQTRNWGSYWIWMNVGTYDNDNNFSTDYFPQLKQAEEVVRSIAWQETAERTVYLFKGN